MNPTSYIHSAMNAAHDDATLLQRIDLNLVVAFDALARERNVTRAAERVGVTQSAMSHALRRLRELLGDEVLVRGRGGMVLTPRGEALVTPLRSALVTMARALGAPAVFEPRTARRAFCIASPDLFDVLVIPPLLERIGAEAPGVDISVVPLNERRVGVALETGEVDIAIAPQVERDAPPPEMSASGIVRRTLLHDAFVCFLRAGHPELAKRKRLTLETFASLSHVLVSPTGEGPGLVDAMLAQHGLTRRIALRIQHFFSALAIVANSDLILTAPSPLARVPVNERTAVVSFPPPLELPGHTISIVWHERFSNDPGHRWLRDLVADITRSATQKPTRAVRRAPAHA
jgi:DNA-binding transcriptional LysR family regulator